MCLEFLRAVFSIFFFVIPAVSVLSAGSLSWAYFSLATRVYVGGCGLSVWSSVLHCGNAVAALQAVGAGHESAKPF